MKQSKWKKVNEKNKGKGKGKNPGSKGGNRASPKESKPAGERYLVREAGLSDDAKDLQGPVGE